MYKIFGKLVSKGPLEVKSEKWTKQEIVIWTGGTYPQKVGLQCSNAVAQYSDKLEVDTEITCSFDLRGNEWKDKLYTVVNCYKIEKGDTTPKAS